MTYLAYCPRCGRKYEDPLKFRCDCGSPLEMEVHADFDRGRVGKSIGSMWRYLSFFPYLREEDLVMLGEGWTPLVRLEKGVYAKLDFLNPTGSFKDRGASAVISAVWRRIVDEGGFVAEDSSGNAGASIAAYAARAGLRARIYVPSIASGQKFNQIRAYGAEVVRVEGSREEVASRAMEPENGKFYLGHAWHPIFRDGLRTIAYEIAEQLGWELPDRIYVPVSSGTGLLGLIDGFSHMDLGKVPQFVACQTEAVSPLYHAFNNLSYTPPRDLRTIADALIVTKPPLLEIMVKKLKSVGGEVDIVGEEAIARSFLWLSRMGIYVEPTSAVAYACYEKQLSEGKVDAGERVVIVLTGSGLKARPKLIDDLIRGAKGRPP